MIYTNIQQLTSAGNRTLPNCRYQNAAAAMNLQEESFPEPATTLLIAVTAANTPNLQFCPRRERRTIWRSITWVEPQEDGTLAIGLDKLAEHLIGNPDSIAMPELGSEIELNGSAWRMKKNGKEIQVRAPIEGKVVAIGSPKDGWYIKIRPRLDPHDPATLRHLLRGSEVDGWLSRELERLQLQLRTPNTAPSLADGGVLIDGVMDAMAEADWDTVLEGTFLEG
jgi:glycine cleavage system H lipoate-binding protein